MKSKKKPFPVSPQQKTTRLVGLDGLRFLAALLVVLFHYGYESGRPHKLYFGDISWPALGPVAMYGYFGVPLFFIISGFVIAWSVGNSDWQGFIRARVRRLVPAFFFCVSLTALVVWLWGAPRFNVTLPQLLANYTFVAPQLGFENIDAVYWTLRWEWQFYLLMAAALWFKWLPRYQMPLITAWLLVCQAAQSLPLPYVAERLIYHLALSDFAGMFALGMLIFYIRQNPHQLLWPCALIALAIWQVCYYMDFYSAYQSSNPPAVDPLLTLGLVIPMVWLVLICVWSEALQKVRFLTWLGLLTYPLYLIHQRIGAVLINKWLNVLPDEIAILTALTFSLVAAVGVAMYVEPWGQRVINRLLRVGR